MENNGDMFAFFEEKLEESWNIHMKAFGPILEPAFADNMQARIILTNALNVISRRNTERGRELLKQVAPYCVCDEDRAAWAFFVGICFEFDNAKKQMIEWYEKAEKYGHRFYLPYLKLAKAAHADLQLERAKTYYEKGIDCLLEMNEQSYGLFIGSAYTNLASCLTMLRQYPEAETALKNAQRYPTVPGISATAAILYASMGNEALSNQYLEKLKKEAPSMLGQTETVIKEILGGDRR